MAQNSVTLKDSDVKSSKSVVFNAGTASTAADVRAETVVGIVIPASMVNTSLKVHGCTTIDGTFIPVRNYDGTDLAFTITNAAQQINSGALMPALAGMMYIKLVGTSSETATVTLLTRSV